MPGKVPFVAAGDEAFPLEKLLLRPHPGAAPKDPEHGTYNYRLSRARRIMECAFGILLQRCKGLFRRFQLSPKMAVKLVNIALSYTTTCQLDGDISNVQISFRKTT